MTGSKFLLEIDDYNILVDCGLFQGLKDLRSRNWDATPIPARDVHAVVLTHAHLDHCGFLPRLVSEGFSGPIYCTQGTERLAHIILEDSAKLQEEEAEYARKKGYSKHSIPQPLYTHEDAEATFHLFNSVDWGTPTQVLPGVHATFHPVGHILGAAWVELTLEGSTQQKTLVFSGDIGRQNDPLLPPPTAPTHADILVMESTYGNRDVEEEGLMENLARIVQESGDGILLIPAFSVGRTQNLLVLLDAMWQKGLAPRRHVFMDSPMAIETTAVYSRFLQETRIPELQKTDPELLERIRNNLTLVESREASRFLNEQTQGSIIISASGMMTGGRVLHHLYWRLPNENNTLLISGFQAAGTRGRAILEGKPSVKIFGQEVPVRCRIEQLDGLSAHGDRTELLQWAANLNEVPKKTFIVHGEKEASESLAGELENRGWHNVYTPEYLESFILFEGI